MPAISNVATVQPAPASDTPFASFISIGPQSRIANRARYTMKQLAPNTHIVGLRYTRLASRYGRASRPIPSSSGVPGSVRKSPSDVLVMP